MNTIPPDENEGCKGCARGACGTTNQTEHNKTPPAHPVMDQHTDRANQVHRDALKQIQDEEGS